MIDLGPPPLVVPTPSIIRPVAGGIWGSIDAEMTRAGYGRNVRRAVIAELRHVIGGRHQRSALDDLTAWARAGGGSTTAGFGLAGKLLRATAAASGLTCIYGSNGTGSGSGPSVTASGMTGLAASGYNLVCIAGRKSGTFSGSSCTIGGVSATQLSTQADTSNARDVIEFWIAASSGSTTGNVVVTWSTTVNNNSTAVVLWAIGGTLSSPTSAYATSVSNDNSGNYTLDLNVPAGGVVVGGVYRASGLGTCTWSGLTEDVDNSEIEAASTVSIAGGTPLAVSATKTSAFNYEFAAAVSLI